MDFLPALSFSVLAGLSLPAWNTIRLGQAWDARLKPGSKVAIVNSKRNVIVSTMTVRATVTGTLTDLVRDHGESNHAILAEKLQGEEAINRLTRILKNAYGTNMAAGDRKATAVYLER